MLTPEQIDALSILSQRAVEPIIEFLLDDITRRIAEAGHFTSSAAYQIWRAQSLGLSRKAIEKELQKRLKVSNKELKKLLRQSAEVGYNFDMKGFGTKAIPFEENDSLQQIIAAAVKLADKDFKNITQTLGFCDPYGNFKEYTDAYISCCDFAFNQVITGATDYNTAIRRATKNLAEKGIHTIDYESGVHTSLEAAVRRNIMGGLGLMQEQISQHNHDAFGANGWEISAHAASAPDHEDIQGKQYTDEEFETLNNSLVRRIGTLNCGHAAFPIILGVNEPQYTQEQLDKFKEDNKKGVTYNGKHYTSYEATQKQRQIERATRRQKRRVLVAESSGDKDRLLTSQIKLRRLNEEYRRYSKAVNLPTQHERLQIAGFGKKQAAQATGAANKYYNEWSKSIGVKDSVKTLDKYYDIKYTTPPRYELLKQYAKDVESGWISPLSGFDNYENLYNRIQTEIVSKEAANGTIIQGQVPHFMQRVIGTMVDPEKLKKDLRIIRRSGVNIDDISDALFNPEKIGPVLIRSTGQKSVKFIGKNCAVSINPDTGYLIQTNPI
ncbi:MAG: hypothetical protein E7547_02835 [Ruminococcaceae bacterium]|nr:hypothetical protein [Oscillospiraceae bacterium]